MITRLRAKVNHAWPDCEPPNPLPPKSNVALLAIGIDIGDRVQA